MDESETIRNLDTNESYHDHLNHESQENNQEVIEKEKLNNDEGQITNEEETKDLQDQENLEAEIQNQIPQAGIYTGDYQNGRYHGHGIYELNGMKYEGTFKNGKFHGKGDLYVEGGVYQGFWADGKLIDGGFVFDDGLPYLKVGYKFWDYCSKYDPRFYSEIKEGVNKGDPLKYHTPHKFVDLLPKDCYDTIDGYYDPMKHSIFSYETNEIIRVPNQEEINWILENCRVGKMDIAIPSNTNEEKLEEKVEEPHDPEE